MPNSLQYSSVNHCCTNTCIYITCMYGQVNGIFGGQLMQTYQHFWLTSISSMTPLLNRAKFSLSKSSQSKNELWIHLKTHALTLCLRKLKNWIPRIKWNDFLHMHLERTYQDNQCESGSTLYNCAITLPLNKRNCLNRMDTVSRQHAEKDIQTQILNYWGP